ncbi:hypothetical protein VP1G_00854 [Cytospora mali]|uniref:Uncharacterized protein n=1 Tax=Cytospora mali TaxID=578113 RepID=A0A194UP73_CYTMA|nr:hypothetical protein VP1G_00854 [Valsa mali var. pyri (nom. inval.)]
MPDQTLAGKVAIVTGSNTGIGAAIAQELSSRGASVVINYPYPELANEANGVVAALPTARTSIAVEADLTAEDGPRKLIDATVGRYGATIHILVNNAGLAVNKPLAEQTLDDWNLLVNLNARAVFLLVQGVLPYLPGKSSGSSAQSQAQAQGLSPSSPFPEQQATATVGGGRIVNIVSISARAAPPLQTIYAGTKGMVDAMTKVWAKELPPRYGCTVNAVSPGPTMTAGFAAAGEEFMREMAPVMAQTPVGHRMAQPEEIAFGVGFLCEPRASWINGLHLIASGGLHIE